MLGRKPIRLPPRNYTGRNHYFVTACTLHRERILTNPDWAHFVVRAIITAAKSTSFYLHAWCVMPDHVHVLAEGAEDASALPRFVQHWKRATTFEFKQRSGRDLWQRIFYDRVLRSTEAVSTVAWYMWLNPVRKGMCREVVDYPWSGSMTEEWMKTVPAESNWVPPWRMRERSEEKARGPNTGRD